MNSSSKYYQLLVRFGSSKDQAIRKPSPELAIMESEDSIQMSLLSSPTLRENKSTFQNHHWSVISEWNRLSQGKDGVQKFQQENIEELESDQKELTSEREKSSQEQDDVQETGWKTNLIFPRLRRGKMMFQRRNILACIIISVLVLIFLIRPDLLQYGKCLFKDFLTLFDFSIDGFRAMV